MHNRIGYQYGIAGRAAIVGGQLNAGEYSSGEYLARIRQHHFHGIARSRQAIKGCFFIHGSIERSEVYYKGRGGIDIIVYGELRVIYITQYQ